MCYKKTPLHVAVTTGDSDMVALLLEFGADRNAPATFWNCCCCEYTPTQFVGMPTGENAPIPPEQRAPIKELLMHANTDVEHAIDYQKQIRKRQCCIIIIIILLVIIGVVVAVVIGVLEVNKKE